MPDWFDWHNLEHTIVETTYHWKEQAGADTLLHFAVTDGEVVNNLVYNNTLDQRWLLNGIKVDRWE